MPPIDHVFVIVMENHTYGEIIGNSQAPYINSLLPGGALATSYFAVAHPSLPNYLALTGGSTFGITSDCTTCWVSASNIADSIENAGKTWRAYEESMPSPCFVGDSYPYVQKHDPLIYFNDIRNNTSRCQGHVVPYSQLSSDLASASTTPNYSFIAPNSCNDMHDCSVGTGDTWLSQHVPQILSSPAFTTQRSMLALLWDEDDYAGTNQVPLIMIGNGVTPNLRSTIGYNHYSTLHTIETALGLPALTSNDAGATVMEDFFGLVGWSRLGGIATSAAHASSWGTAGTSAFVRGTDSALYQRSWSGSTWTNWQSLGGILTSSPAAVSWGPNRIDVFVRGSDNALYHKNWNGAVWSLWESLGGVLTSGPAAAAWSSGRLDVFVRGSDNALYHKSWNGAQWSSWEYLDGILTSDPAAVSWGTNRIDVFVRGTDHGLWQKSYDGQSWNSWNSLGGILSSGPDSSSCASGHLDVIVVGSDQALYQRGFNGAWTPWQRMGGYWIADPGAVCPAGINTIQLFEIAPDMSVVQSTATGS